MHTRKTIKGAHKQEDCVGNNQGADSQHAYNERINRWALAESLAATTILWTHSQQTKKTLVFKCNCLSGKQLYN